MNSIKFLLLFLFFSTITNAQIVSKEIEIVENDTIMQDTILLEEVIIQRGKIDVEARKQFQLLRNRVYKTYPYAKLASERLVSLNKGMASLKTNREKKKYFKIVERYLEDEFEAQLKKLSRKQGQILIKLIHRQTGETTFELVKSLKSGWTAFWSNTTAKMFDLNMKTEYLPFEVNEDYLIESILQNAIEMRRLPYQKPANPVNYEKLTDYWVEKARKQG